MDFLNQDDSYADRRRLFKSIWEAAMDIDEKDPDIMKKPKVIKTLRLDEVDRCVVGKTKKQRIKNLRTVCNKILEFCDKQDADDVFYEHMAIDAQQRESQLHKVDPQAKKLKRIKKKIKKARSMFAPIIETTKLNPAIKSPRNVSHTSKKHTIMRASTNTAMKQKASPTNARESNSGMSGDNTKRRKTFRKKIIKRKQANVAQSTTGNVNRPLTRRGYLPLSKVKTKLT